MKGGRKIRGQGGASMNNSWMILHATKQVCRCGITRAPVSPVGYSRARIGPAKSLMFGLFQSHSIYPGLTGSSWRDEREARNASGFSDSASEFVNDLRMERRKDAGATRAGATVARRWPPANRRACSSRKILLQSRSGCLGPRRLTPHTM